MSLVDNLKEQLKTLGTSIGQKVQESQLYGQAMDRYENMSPVSQKVFILSSFLIVLVVLLFIPFSNLSNSQSSISLFEEKRNLIRELFKTFRESSANPQIEMPPPYDSLRSSIDGIIARAELLPEQNLGILEVAPEGRLIPESLVSNVLQLKLAKLNLKQIIDIGASVLALSNSVKMKDLLITANMQDTRYYDVTYKMYSLKVPPPLPEAPPEPEKPSKKAKDSKNSKDSNEANE